jgi:Leucine-rich repeat (LRR) protein
LIISDDNLLTGPLPEWSAALVTRQELTVSHNQLIGTIPSVESLRPDADFDLESIRLKDVDISYNLCNGTLPVLTAYVHSIRFLDVSGNAFSGSFPSGDNGYWPRLEHIGARDCQFEGTFPHGFSTLLTHLDFAGNQLTGGIPVELSKFKRLNTLSMSNNRLSSTIPVDVTEMPSLQVIEARNCSLTGTIPIGFASNNARVIDLGLNQLTGNLYSEFGSVAELEILTLDGNAIVGSIPSELGSMELLTTLILDNNLLTGTIPSEFNMLRNLIAFTVANNSLNGSLPTGLCSVLPDLRVEDIGCNIKCSCCSGQGTCGD